MDYVIIVAGGKGMRMGAPLPKQFLQVGGRPILQRTLMRFHEYDPQLNIILVLPAEQQDFWRKLCPMQGSGIVYRTADGGATRFHSVRNGLDLIPDNAQGVVAVHDGVRPFPAVSVIRDCYETARRTGAAIPVTPVIETLRHLEGGNAGRTASVTVPRSDYRLVQTPQTFDIQLLKRAYRQDYTDLFTDDASVVEHAGHAVTLVEGNRENIKITTPFDMKVAEALIQ